MSNFRPLTEGKEALLLRSFALFSCLAAILSCTKLDEERLAAATSPAKDNKHRLSSFMAIIEGQYMECGVQILMKQQMSKFNHNEHHLEFL